MKGGVDQWNFLAQTAVDTETLHGSKTRLNTFMAGSLSEVTEYVETVTISGNPYIENSWGVGK